MKKLYYTLLCFIMILSLCAFSNSTYSENTYKLWLNQEEIVYYKIICPESNLEPIIIGTSTTNDIELAKEANKIFKDYAQEKNDYTDSLNIIVLKITDKELLDKIKLNKQNEPQP